MSISIPGADYTPQLTGYTGQGAFRFWCQKVLPIVYDDSLSYYELLNKVVNYLNNVIADVASVENNIGQLNTSYINLQNFVNETNDNIESEINVFETFVTTTVRELQTFVNNYFDNLDVQQEINHKLDAMASDGSLTALLMPLIASEAPGVIEQWMAEHITPTTPVIDSSLSIAGAAADAKATGDVVSDLKSAITQTIPAPTWTDGYISSLGEVRTSSNYQYSSPIEISYGRIVVELTDDIVVSVVARYNESDGTYTPLLVGEGTNVHKQYIYDVTTPGKYVISYRKENGKSEIRIITTPQINSLFVELQNEVFTGRTGELKYKLIPDEYVNAYGVHASEGWSRTPKIIVRDFDYININTPTAVPSGGTNYNIFYDKNDNVVSGFVTLSVGDNFFNIPNNAYYLILSQDTDIISNYTVTCGMKSKLIDQNLGNIAKATLGLTGLTGGQMVKIPYWELSHSDLANENVDPNSRLATEIFKMRDGSANSLILTMVDPNYSMKICAFYKDGDNYVLDWQSNWTTHYRIAPYQRNVNGLVKAVDYLAVVFGDRNTNRTLTMNDQFNISEGFYGYEENNPAKYYRIATFNLARRWGVFNSQSSDEYSKWQISQYKNIFGSINPDVLCMQEAIGVTGLYIDMDQHFPFAANVLTHKFAFNSYYSDTRQSTKYVFGDYTNTIYQTQREGSYKQFTKCHVNIDGHSVCVFNTHTEYHGDYEEYLKPQMEELIAAMKAAMDNHECDYVIACGDFNAWHPSDFDVFVENGFKLCNCGTFGDKVTWPWIDYSDPGDLVTNPDDPTGPKIPKVWNMSCLDNIIVSSNIEIQNVGVVKLYEASEDLGHNWPLWKDNKPYSISDHFPLYADICFK